MKFILGLILALFVVCHHEILWAGDLPAAINTSVRKEKLLAVFKVNKITGQEAVTRLILAETMASHCLSLDHGNAEEIEAIMKGIAKVIRNRIGTRENDRELSVVFASNQFNSSLAKYACSEAEGFLNPALYEGKVPGLNGKKLWEMAQKAYEAAWTAKAFEKRDEEVKNYYLHQHDRQGKCHLKVPAWVQSSPEIRVSGSPSLVASARECVGFYILQ